MNALRYVVLWHSGVDEPHFDFMIETAPKSDLATWRSAQWPIEETTGLTRLRDHRRFYLEYEGEISALRGNVTRIDSGRCEVEVGEGGVWRLRLMERATVLTLNHLEDDKWEATPG